MALSCGWAGGIIGWNSGIRHNEGQKVGLMSTIGKGLDHGHGEQWGVSWVWRYAVEVWLTPYASSR